MKERAEFVKISRIWSKEITKAPDFWISNITISTFLHETDVQILLQDRKCSTSHYAFRKKVENEALYSIVITDLQTKLS